MTFEEYCLVIETTVRQQGYDAFLPSMYDSSRSPGLRVCSEMPEPGTDEQFAQRWARPYMRDGKRLYLAYRSDPGVIQVCEFMHGTRVRCVKFTVPMYRGLQSSQQR